MAACSALLPCQSRLNVCKQAFGLKPPVWTVCCQCSHNTAAKHKLSWWHPETRPFLSNQTLLSVRYFRSIFLFTLWVGDKRCIWETSNTASTFIHNVTTQTQHKESLFQCKQMCVFEVVKSYTGVLSRFLAVASGEGAKLCVIHYTV